jgi:lipopolysaccharide/colanic/teichoic acid biosynthesis glycosyltransferase
MSTENVYTQDQLKSLEQRLEGSTRRAAFRNMKLICWRLTIGAGHASKRMLDIIVSLAALVMLSPLLLLVAIMIKLTDFGPILFWQIRVGKWGKTFLFPKFRSMVVNAEALQAALISANEHGNGITFKIKRDPRITRIGRIIRKTSIDELPQLWCVLKGEMSLVGPRPALVHEVARYTLDDRSRLDAIPGLTCIWQVSGRSKIPFPEQVNLDVQYIEQQSMWTDLKLLFLTIPAVITGRGAY